MKLIIVLFVMMFTVSIFAQGLRISAEAGGETTSLKVLGKVIEKRASYCYRSSKLMPLDDAAGLAVFDFGLPLRIMKVQDNISFQRVLINGTEAKNVFNSLINKKSDVIIKSASDEDLELVESGITVSEVKHKNVDLSCFKKTKSRMLHSGGKVIVSYTYTYACGGNFCKQGDLIRGNNTESVADNSLVKETSHLIPAPAERSLFSSSVQRK